MDPLSVAWKIAAMHPELASVAVSGASTFYSGVVPLRAGALVKSKSKGWIRVTRIAATSWFCGCDAFRYGGVRVNDHPLCKHVIAAMFAAFSGTDDEFIQQLLGLTFRPIVEIRFARQRATDGTEIHDQSL